MSALTNIIFPPSSLFIPLLILILFCRKIAQSRRADSGQTRIYKPSGAFRERHVLPAPVLLGLFYTVRRSRPGGIFTAALSVCFQWIGTVFYSRQRALAEKKEKVLNWYRVTRHRRIIKFKLIKSEIPNLAGFNNQKKPSYIDVNHVTQ